MKSQRSLSADFLLLAAAWGSSFLFMRLGAIEFGAWSTAGLRIGIAALAMLPLLLLRCDLQLVRRKAVPLLLVVARKCVNPVTRVLLLLLILRSQLRQLNLKRVSDGKRF